MARFSGGEIDVERTRKITTRDLAKDSHRALGRAVVAAVNNNRFSGEQVGDLFRIERETPCSPTHNAIGGPWGTDVLSETDPDLFAAKPVVFTAATRPVKGTVRILGKVSGRDFARPLNVDLPAAEPRHDTLASLWARTKIDDLMAQDFNGIQSGRMSDDLRNQINQARPGFPADDTIHGLCRGGREDVTEDGKPPRRIEVPVEMPDA